MSAVFPGRLDVVTLMKSKDRPEVRVTTFYPGTTDPAAGQSVGVTPGSRIAGIDFAIVRSRLYQIGAHIDVAPGLRAGGRLMYSIVGLYPAGASYSANSNGDLLIPGVPPGSYKMQIYVNEPERPAGAVFDPARVLVFCSLTVPVVVERADLEGLRITAGGCAMMTGHVTVEGKDPPALAGGIVGFEHDEGHYAMLRADGTFATSLSPGVDNINLSRITKEKGLYVKSISAGKQDVLRAGFTASSLEHVELEIVLASDGGDVTGIVSMDGKPVLGATVVLIPNDPALRSRMDYTRDAATDQTGHFEIKNAAPGEYKLFAWDDIEPGGWFDPEVVSGVEARGEPVTVKAKAPNDQSAAAQSITLRAIQ